MEGWETWSRKNAWQNALLELNKHGVLTPRRNQPIYWQLSPTKLDNGFTLRDEVLQLK